MENGYKVALSSLPVSRWAKEDRPDYKLENFGARNMTNSELLSIVIGNTYGKINSVDIAKQLLADNHNSLFRISNKCISELTQSVGIGSATAKRILAALELGKRSLTKTDVYRVESAVDVYKTMSPIIGDLENEEFWVLLMDSKNHLKKKVLISKGGLTGTAVDIRLVMNAALLNNTTVLVACHNHPSGVPTPSREDDVLTDGIKKACEVMRIYFLDHVIIGYNEYYSYRESGKI